MSVAAGQSAIVTAVEAIVVPQGAVRGRFHFTDGKPPLEQRCSDARACELRVDTWSADAGLASTGFAQLEAVWLVCVLYPCPAGTDRRRLEQVAQDDLDAISAALLSPAAWLPHLDLCYPDGPARVDELPGTAGETVALLAQLPVRVFYRS